MLPNIMHADRKIDVLGLGCIAVDDLLYVKAYPAADAKTAVLRRDRQCGGLAARALVAASRLGAGCSYAGQLGDDTESAFVESILDEAGIYVGDVARIDAARPLRSAIIVDESSGTRNIFYHVDPVTGAHPRLPKPERIRAAKVLLVDRFGIPGMIRAAKIARKSGVSVVGDFENHRWPRFGELIRLVDHLIVSEDFAREYTDRKDPAEGALRLWGKGRAMVAVTCGANGCWWMDARHPTPRHMPAFQVRAVDTTGCGDVFHGAYAAALAAGLDVEARLRFASAAAALKAMRSGGDSGIPDLEAVEAFLAQTALRRPPTK